MSRIFFIVASLNESYDCILDQKYFGHPRPSVWPIWWLIFSLWELNMGSKNCPTPSILNICIQFWCTSVSLCVNQKNLKTKRRIKKEKKERKIFAIFRHHFGPLGRYKFLIYSLKGIFFCSTSYIRTEFHTFLFHMKEPAHSIEIFKISKF